MDEGKMSYGPWWATYAGKLVIVSLISRNINGKKTNVLLQLLQSRALT